MRRGFTSVEFIIAVAAIFIAAGLFWLSWRSYQERTRQAARDYRARIQESSGVWF